MESVKTPARWILFLGLGIFLLLLLYQFYQVGDAVFKTDDFEGHETVGLILRFYGPVLFVAAIFAGLKRSELIVAALLGLSTVLQPGFAEGDGSSGWLHAVNALVMGLLAWYLFWGKYQTMKEWSNAAT